MFRELCAESFWVLFILGLSITFINYVELFLNYLFKDGQKDMKFDLFGADSFTIFGILNVLAVISFPDLRFYLSMLYFVTDLCFIFGVRYSILYYRKRMHTATMTDKEFREAVTNH